MLYGMFISAYEYSAPGLSLRESLLIHVHQGGLGYCNAHIKTGTHGIRQSNVIETFQL